MSLVEYVYEMSNDEKYGKWSDLHIKEGAPLSYRDKSGDIIRTDKVINLDEIKSLIQPVLDKEERTLEKMMKEEQGDYDFALKVVPEGVDAESATRFRCSIYYFGGTRVGLVMRKINEDVIPIDSLNLPPVSRTFNKKTSGLVLVTGPTGSGKSTTLAAMIQEINETRSENIITVEDPIEYMYTEDKCIISQREIGKGKDSQSFHKALRGALRQDPDVMLIGEIRDSETANMCLEAAQTGHLVFGTLHTKDAITTIQRFIQMFESDDKSRVRNVLADVLVGVISQALVPKIGGGKMMIPEVLNVNDKARVLIKNEEKANQMPNLLNSDTIKSGNVSINTSLENAVINRLISPETCFNYCVDLDDMKKRLRAKNFDFDSSGDDQDSNDSSDTGTSIDSEKVERKVEKKSSGSLFNK